MLLYEPLLMMTYFRGHRISQTALGDVYTQGKVITDEDVQMKNDKTNDNSVNFSQQLSSSITTPYETYANVAMKLFLMTVTSTVILGEALYRSLRDIGVNLNLSC